MSENITRPPHYGGEENPFEPIKIINWYKLDFNLGNTIKYILRAGKKKKTNKLYDLLKARQYIDFAISEEEKNS